MEASVSCPAPRTPASDEWETRPAREFTPAYLSAAVVVPAVEGLSRLVRGDTLAFGVGAGSERPAFVAMQGGGDATR
jgi:hypothetical protein